MIDGWNSHRSTRRPSDEGELATEAIGASIVVQSDRTFSNYLLGISTNPSVVM